MNIGKYVELYSEDLKLKNYAENTISNYSSQVKLFLEYFNKVATKPSEISEKQIKQWLLFLFKINYQSYNQNKNNTRKNSIRKNNARKNPPNLKKV